MDTNPYETPKSLKNNIPIKKGINSPQNSIQSWVITVSILFFSISSIILALLCIFALPDKSVKPLEGSLFFLGGSIVLIALLLFRWKKERALFPDNKIFINENLSDKIIKWITAFFCLGYAYWGLAVALICIYALPDQSIQPKTGAAYFLGGTIVVGTLAFVVWKNWISRKL